MLMGQIILAHQENIPNILSVDTGPIVYRPYGNEREHEKHCRPRFCRRWYAKMLKNAKKKTILGFRCDKTTMKKKNYASHHDNEATKETT